MIANDVGHGFNMTMGWEYRSWRSSAYNWLPESWRNNTEISRAGGGVAIGARGVELLAAGDMNLMVSNMSDPEWPRGRYSWEQIYCHEGPAVPDLGHRGVGSMSALLVPPSGLGEAVDGPGRVWASNGFQSTYTYDMGLLGSYSIQGAADHGILESWDGGRSWTQFSVPNAEVGPTAPSRCTAVLISPNVTIREGSTTAGTPQVPTPVHKYMAQISD